MILLISAQQPLLDGPVDERFGRSPWLVKMDTETNHWEAFPNPGASQSGGAGVAAAQFVIDQQANAVVSGDFGPHAANVFRAAGIQMRLFSDETATVRQAVEYLLQDKLIAFE
jgi:predicted Fe-Mo cluster-binding NifX family protein